MADITEGNPTLLDLAKSKDPDGSIAAVVEILQQENEMLLDASWREGNLATGHKTTLRTGIPTPTCLETNAHALARYAAICVEGGLVPILALTSGRAGRPACQLPGIRTTMPAVSSFGTSVRNCKASDGIQRSGW